MFLRAFWEAQMHAYEHAAGWVRLRFADHPQLTLADTIYLPRADLLEF